MCEGRDQLLELILQKPLHASVSIAVPAAQLCDPLLICREALETRAQPRTRLGSLHPIPNAVGLIQERLAACDVASQRGTSPAWIPVYPRPLEHLPLAQWDISSLPGRSTSNPAAVGRRAYRNPGHGTAVRETLVS